MKTLRFLRFAAALALGFSAASFSFAGSAEDVARAAALVQRMVELNQKFSAYDVELAASAPLAGTKGKFLLPIDENGALTGWAQKALNAQVGNVAGEQAGAAASKGLASVVPGGGLASGLLKKKGKETGAMLALGGAEYVKQTSSLSFDSVEAYAIYLHAKMGKSADYSKSVQAAIALYPDLEKTYSASVSAAFDAAMKDVQAKKAAADALAAKEKAEREAAAAGPTTSGTAPTVAAVTPVPSTPAVTSAADAPAATP